MYCKICGAALSPGDVFCKNCGASNAMQNPQPAVPSQQASAPEPQLTVPIIEPVENINQTRMTNQPQVNQPTFSQPPQPPVFSQPSQLTPPQPPVFSQPQQPVSSQSNDNDGSNNSNINSKSKVLPVIGIVVGILAVTVIAYLFYTSLVDKKEQNQNNSTNTTIVTKNNYVVEFDGYRFTVDDDYIAVIQQATLFITYGDVKAVISAAPTDVTYNLVTEQTIRKTVTATDSITVESVSEKTYNGTKYWKVDIYAPTDGSRCTYAYIERSDSKLWEVQICNQKYTKISDVTVEEFVALAKNATKSTSSNIEDKKEALNFKFDFSLLDVEGQES